MSNKEIDDLIVNLKVLSGLEQNKKLITKETFLNVEKPNILPESVKRYWRGDSRHETIKKIDLVINQAIEALPTRPDLITFIENTKKGITNLKETYTDCNQTKARLDTIIVKIDRLIEQNEYPRPRANSLSSNDSDRDTMVAQLNLNKNQDI